MRPRIVFIALCCFILSANASLKKERIRREANKQMQMKAIDIHNAGNSTFKMGLTKVNKFGEKTWDEFKKEYLMNVDMSKAERFAPPAESEYYHGPLPKHFDWRQHGAVTVVGDQEPCGCCYAFSATGNIESVWKVKKGVLKELSKQQIVDCCRIPCSTSQSEAAPECCDGCNKGYTGTALRYIYLKGGIEAETDYRFIADAVQNTDQCHFNRSEVAATIDGHVMLPSKDEDRMARYLYKHGAVSISIHANDALTNYKSGIFDQTPEECPNGLTDLDHAVLLVGFGEEKGIPYWIVKNSWSSSWGEEGYVRMRRGKNLCGIAMYVTSAVVN